MNKMFFSYRQILFNGRVNLNNAFGLGKRMVELLNEQSDRKSALRGTNLYKSYRTGGIFLKTQKTVLDNLNINVRDGQM
jgi:hypothetical protein